jgi:hypothetical protein
MTKARNSSGTDYVCKYDWGCFVQCGGSGIVFSKDGSSYTTAFFEAFPNNPKCFLRGEGNTVQDAEESCWLKYQKLLSCDHEMERRDRTDGYGYCKHCSYSSMVFEPLTKCCKCGLPAAYGKDYKNRWYCKKHHKMRPKNPNPPKISFFSDELPHHRIPRKYKKLIKKAAKIKFKSELGYDYKITSSVSCLNDIKLTCGDRRICLLFETQKKKLLDLLKK